MATGPPTILGLREEAEGSDVRDGITGLDDTGKGRVNPGGPGKPGVPGNPVERENGLKDDVHAVAALMLDTTSF